VAFSAFYARPTNQSTSLIPTFTWTKDETKSKYTAWEWSLLCNNRLITEHAKFTKSRIYSDTNYDVPSNKLNKAPNHKKCAHKSPRKNKK
jgi:hypothetical protein